MSTTSALAARFQKTLKIQLDAAFEGNDTTKITAGIGEAISTVGYSEVARTSGLDRSSLYRTFGGKANPGLESTIKALKALGFELTVTPIK